MTTKANAGQDAVGKKPYEAPRLEVYGDVREIARSISKTGMADGATMGNTRTA